MKIIYWGDEDGAKCPSCLWGTCEKFYLEGEDKEAALCGTCFCIALQDIEAEVKIND